MEQTELTYRLGYEAEWLHQAIRLFNDSGLKRSDVEQVKRGLENSDYVMTCWSGERLVGIGRMLTDGAMYASIFDVAVDPSFQKRGIGREIMTRLIALVPGACIHLTSTFGNEPFYNALGFRPHKTAMALYPEALKSSPYLVHNEAD